MSTVLLDPRVIDASTLQPKATSAVYLQPAVEGVMTTGTGNVGVIYVIDRLDQASATFGPDSKIYMMIKVLLDRGAGPVMAIASATGGATPTLAARQAAWEKLESAEEVRLRLTDSEVQADLSALAVSAAQADSIYNKQIAFGGMPSGTSKSNLIAAATAVATGGIAAATRFVLVGPGVYDDAGVLRGGSFAAAAAAAEVAKNSDPGNDLDLWDIPLLTSIERDASGLPIFRRRVQAGLPVNDYEDLLQGGVSPLQPSRVAGGVATTHLRTAYVTNTSYDNLYTRVIVDQVFVDVKNYLYDNNYFRFGNTQTVRDRMKSGVQAVLQERQAWIEPVQQPDGTLGYNVTCTPSADMRQVTVGYEGRVVRGISTIKVAASLTITV